MCDRIHRNEFIIVVMFVVARSNCKLIRTRKFVENCNESTLNRAHTLHTSNNFDNSTELAQLLCLRMVNLNVVKTMLKLNGWANKVKTFYRLWMDFSVDFVLHRK